MKIVSFKADFDANRVPQITQKRFELETDYAIGTLHEVEVLYVDDRSRLGEEITCGDASGMYFNNKSMVMRTPEGTPIFGANFIFSETDTFEELACVGLKALKDFINERIGEPQ